MTPTDAIEILRPDLPRGRFKAVLFDFDGTLSLLREGWPAIMTEMMLAELRRTGGDDGDARIVDEIVVGMNGRPTIVQMQALATELGRRGGRPLEAVVYAAEYQERLLHMIRGRYEAIQSKRVAPAAWAVPGIHGLLAELRKRRLLLFLLSGSELTHVRHEADMLGLTDFFGDAVFAPNGNDPQFSKRALIEQLVKDHDLRGDQLLGFGDGVVETEEVRRIGGVAVAVASEEPPRRGVHAGKRERLIRAGADAVIGDYDCHEELLRWLFT